MCPPFIILVEDDSNLRQSIALILRREGYLVTETDSISNAQEIIQTGNLQLIIADFDMPKVKNALLPKVLETYPYLSIVIMTGLPASDLGKEDRLLSAHYLTKPIAPERLLDCVGSILAEKSYRDHE